MPDLLLELLSEEIPARMQRKAAGDLRRLVTDGLVAEGLTYEGAREHWTPRRLVLDVRGVDARSRDVVEERKGPRTDANPKAIEGFLKSAGLAAIGEAEVRADARKGDFYVALTRRPGRAAEDILAGLLPGLLADFPWPKSMRWGAASAQAGSFRWVRPLQGILCTFGPETAEPVVVNFAAGGIRSGNTTQGHRFHAPAPIRARRFEDYAASLAKAFVVLDADRRKDIIRTDSETLAFASGLEVVPDEGLLEEVAGLVEWPVVLAGTFDPAFLAIPPEVAQLTIRANQKCFVTRREGALSPTFFLVANIEARDGGAEIARGNGKVVGARLSDALYFWQTDQGDLPDRDALRPAAERLGLDLAKPLDQRMAKLDALGVTFHARLGTQGQRVERIAALAETIAPSVGADPALARRAALLAKADLASEAVGEFPELQGLMGRYYAALQGEHPGVQAAIEDHYKPQGPGDRVPTDPVAIAVALADKLDTLVGFWAIDEKPTGSKDPYALRRAALGVIRIVLENSLPLDLASVLPGHFERSFSGTDAARIAFELIGFLAERLKVQLREGQARHDLVDAVMNVGIVAPGRGEGVPNVGNLLFIVRRLEALSAFLATDDGQNLLAGTRRAENILAAEERKGTRIAEAVDPARLVEPQERVLAGAVDRAEMELAAALEGENYAGAMTALARLRAPVDDFFEAILVNAADEDLRANRLALLARIRAATRQVADFAQIAG